VFIAIEDYIEKNRADATKIGVVYLFKLTSPDSSWTVDLKAGKVTAGEVGKAQCTLELSDADFIAMTSGKADSMKLFMDKKLRISGDIMASQKLEFLKKIDKDSAAKAIAARKGSAPAQPQAQAKAPKADSPAPKVFEALKKRLEQNGKLAAEVGAVLQFTVDGKSWVVDLSSGAGSVKEGTDPKAATLFTLEGQHLLALVKGTGSAHDLFQHGQLRVDGDVHYAKKLGILKDLV
jgi:3-hydroxyacyl-CoA dehydrogenase/3a,7a,12a-trihydroxy-5b-cholest-24-enoyl-CoA hydratase